MVYEKVNDRFGYSKYLIIALAPDRINQQARAVRDAVGMDYENPAHVTIVAPFFGFNDLDQIKEIVRSVSASIPKPYINFKDSKFEGHPEYGTAGFELFGQDDVLAFQRRLESAIVPHLGGVEYPYRYPVDWMYRKHMNFVLGLDEERLKLAVGLGSKVEIGDGFLVDKVTLRAYSTDDGEVTPHVLDECPVGEGD